MEDRVVPALTWDVTSAADDGGAGTLRSVILNQALSGDTIHFDTTKMGSTTIYLNASIPIANKNLTIDGEMNGVTVSGNNATQLFTITGTSAVEIDNLSLVNGKITGDSGGAINDRAGSLTLKNDTFLSNTASGAGGAVYTQGGTLAVTDCSFGNNIAGASGGAISADFVATAYNVQLTQSTFYTNRAGYRGGAVAVNSGEMSQLTIDTCTFQNNGISSGSGDGARSGPRISFRTPAAS